MNTELSQLIKLQDIDLEIKTLQEEITSIPARRKKLETQFEESVKEYLELKQKLEESVSRKENLETDLEDEQQKHQKFKNDLMKATNEREYSTAIREIDVAAKAISSLETDILKLMDAVEKFEAELKEKTPAMETSRAEVDKQISEWDSLTEQNTARLESLRVDRTAMMESLNPNARSTYDRLSKMRSGQPLAEARDYSCQACRMTIRPQVFNDIRRGDQIITCENCGRILYFNAETVAS